MTVQIMDVVTHEKADYHLLYAAGDGLFQPELCGIKDYDLHTACWRGFFCRYEVSDDRLLLTGANIGLIGEDREAALRGGGPEVYGRKPRFYREHGYEVVFLFFRKPSSWWASDVAYKDLREPMPFTGAMLLGADAVRGWGVWPLPHCYASVRELFF